MPAALEAGIGEVMSETSRTDLLLPIALWRDLRQLFWSPLIRRWTMPSREKEGALIRFAGHGLPLFELLGSEYTQHRLHQVL